MYITSDIVLNAVALITAIGTLIALLYRLFRWTERQKNQDKELEHIKAEQCMICFALFATLDGLKQLGANGNVSEAYNELEKYLNKSAHNKM